MGAKRVRRPYMEKARKIQEATLALESGSITSTMFLDRLVFSRNQVCTDWEPYEDIFECENDSEPDLEIETEVDNVQNVSKCIICLENAPNVAFLPCKHLKCCRECVLKLEAQSLVEGLNNIKCPYCRTLVNDTLEVFV